MTAAVVQSSELQAALSATRHQLESKAAHLDVLAKRAAELEAELEEQIRQECAARAALEEQIADARAALAEAWRDNQSAAADVARHGYAVAGRAVLSMPSVASRDGSRAHSQGGGGRQRDECLAQHFFPPVLH